MKICFLSHYSEMGGAERALLETAEALRECGVNSVVFLPQGGGLCKELDARGIPFRIFPYRWWAGSGRVPYWRIGKDLILSLAAVVPMAMEIRRQRCDLVATNTITIGVGALSACVARLPHVWFIHEFFGTPQSDLSFYLGARISLTVMDRLSTLCIANSRTVVRAYRDRLPRVALISLYQSVTPSLTGPRPGERTEPLKGGAGAIPIPDGKRVFRCVSVGTLCALKGQIDAVRAVAELAQAGDEVELDLVGGGDPKYADLLQRVVAEERIEHLVRFRGPVEDAFPIIQQADAVLICSRSESFGRVTVEAMLAGKPVIGARLGATGELVQEDFNGILYRPGDSSDLAGKIRRLMNHPDQALRMGRNGKAWSDHLFSRQRYAEELFATLTPLLRRPAVI